MAGFLGVNNRLQDDTGYLISANVNPDFAPAVDNRTSTEYVFAWDTVGDVVFEIDLQAAQSVNFLGIARHNLGNTGSTTILLQYFDGAWQDFQPVSTINNNQPIIIIGPEQTAQQWRIVIQNPEPASEIRLLMLGYGIELPRISAPHELIGYARQQEIVAGATGMAFLGPYARTAVPGFSFTLDNYLPEELDPIENHSINFICRSPFFYSYRNDLTNQDFNALLVTDGQPALPRWKNVCLKSWQVKTIVLDG